MKQDKRSRGHVELGLAISRVSLAPGETRSHEDLAAFCGVSHRAIQKIEEKALRKVRPQLLPIWRELLYTK